MGLIERAYILLRIVEATASLSSLARRLRLWSFSDSNLASSERASRTLLRLHLPRFNLPRNTFSAVLYLHLRRFLTFSLERSLFREDQAAVGSRSSDDVLPPESSTRC